MSDRKAPTPPPVNQIKPDPPPAPPDPRFDGFRVPVGMTLRDYFAAQALPQVLRADFADDPRDFDAATSARTAYVIADAMVRERAR